MLSREIIAQQLPHTLSGVEIPDAESYYSGKVRECFTVKSALSGAKRILVATDRLSAFDRILTTVPFKGALLNGMADYWFRETKGIAENHVIEVPHPNVFVCEEVEIIPVEVVVRGYLAGSSWRDYSAGRDVSGVRVKPGKRKNEKFSTPLITPSTKAEKGHHDLPISGRELVSQGVVEKGIWDEICRIALALFDFGTQRAAERGLILVDTKYELGLRPGTKQVVVADEIHTQDSSRYWIAATYPDRFEAGEDPEMLDKEFVRRWLMEQDFFGDGEPPPMTEEFRIETAERYMDAYERITGKPFTSKPGDLTEEVIGVVKEYL